MTSAKTLSPNKALFRGSRRTRISGDTIQSTATSLSQTAGNNILSLGATAQPSTYPTKLSPAKHPSSVSLSWAPEKLRAPDARGDGSLDQLLSKQLEQIVHNPSRVRTLPGPLQGLKRAEVCRQVLQGEGPSQFQPDRLPRGAGGVRSIKCPEGGVVSSVLQEGGRQHGSHVRDPICRSFSKGRPGTQGQA